jgi:cytochrome bd-type quinol oxidase subunit 2
MGKSIRKITLITNIVIIALSALAFAAGLIVVFTDGESAIGKKLAVSVTSIMALIAIVLILVFTIIQLASNIKQLVKVLIMLVVAVAVFLLCYLIAPVELSDTAKKVGMDATVYKMIGASLYFGYIILAGVIIALIGSFAYVKIKN